MTTSEGGEVEFRQFDVVSDVSDHHFIGKPSKANSCRSHKKIMQEWKILQKDLPESIFVRVYETRTDLLRAAIIGARGTPYHDGLFFFDLHFPSDYPTRPPLVHYRSLGNRINPNLYADGKVCLSLLNTWSGNKTERWNSNQSTILQVLVSIQALVLNEKPFFNEPIYGPSLGKNGWDKTSNAYNENVFVLNCKSMIKLIWFPPRNFEPLIKLHFKNRSQFILSAFEGYRKGLFQVGYFYSDLGQKVEVSSKFKKNMDQLHGKLVEAMLKTEASLDHFIEQLGEENEKKAKQSEEANTKEKGGLGKRVVKTLKNILFLGFLTQKKSKTSPVLEPQSA